jgi:hypothetical protein
MSMNRYGVKAQRHWARWLPRQYAAISDPESFFTTLGKEVARRIDDLTDELVGEVRQSDSYLAHVGRLFAARVIAEELILPQRVLPDPELAADDHLTWLTVGRSWRLYDADLRVCGSAEADLRTKPWA